MSARDDILKAVAKALPRRRLDAASIAAEARLLVSDLEAVRPSVPQQSVIESFIQRVAASKVGATIDRIASMDNLPDAVAGFLGTRKLPAQIALQPSRTLAALDWAAAGLHRVNTVDDNTAVGLASWGIAETGSLVFHSAADMPILFNFLPALHIVAVRASSIVPHLEDYAAVARNAGDPAPRNACLITGASGTTDIEGSLVLGAHGPRELRVIVIDGPAATP